MPFFDIFVSPRWSPLRMRTKVVSFFIFFQELSNKKKIMALRPKMTKIVSRGSCLKGEVYPEMKLCELLVLVHCIHLPLILFACASSGQSYNIDCPVVPNCCDVIDTAMTGDPIAFCGFLNFSGNVLFWSLHASSMFIFTLLRVSG